MCRQPHTTGSGFRHHALTIRRWHIPRRETQGALPVRDPEPRQILLLLSSSVPGSKVLRLLRDLVVKKCLGFTPFPDISCNANVKYLRRVVHGKAAEIS